MNTKKCYHGIIMQL